jgi:general secretion pathway protein A
MINQYLTYWGLKKIPFSLTPDPDMLYLSSQHRECLLRLKYAIQSNKGGALLVSEQAGDGKTSVLSRLRQDMESEYGEKVRLVFIDHPTLTPTQIISEIARQLGAPENYKDKVRALNQLRDTLQCLHETDHKTIVVVDEGHMLSHRLDLLQELRILLNFCVADAFLLTFIFSGQKPLEGIVRNMPEFWQRLPVRFFLKNLSLNETKELIRFRLSRAGHAGNDIFTDFAYETIYKFSKGVPRVICSVADLCLVIGHSHGVRRIDFAQVSLACKDMEGGGEGFHYFHFLEKGKQEETKMPRESDYVPMIPCPHCQAAVGERKKTCPECEKPIVVKCPRCETQNWASVTVCKKCGCDITKEEDRRERNLSAKLRSLDSLKATYSESTATVAASYGLPPHNRVILAILRGNLFKIGPEIEMVPRKGKSLSGKGTVVFTNEHLILDLKKRRIFLPYYEIKRSWHGNLNMKKDEGHQTMSFDSTDASYSIKFPFSKAGAKELIDLLIPYVKHKSL